MRQVQVGTPLFIFNTSTKELYGPFRVTEVGYNLNERIWGGRFKHQLRFQRIFNSPTLDAKTVNSLLKRGRTGYYIRNLTDSDTGRALQAFEKAAESAWN